MKTSFFDFFGIFVSEQPLPVTTKSQIDSAIKAGDLKRMLALLASDPSVFSNKHNIDSRDSQGSEWLHTAIFYQQQEIVTYLLDAGLATTESRGTLNKTPLLTATPSNDNWSRKALLIVRELLNRGANPNTPGNDGETPLHRAAGLQDTTILELLLTMAVNINAQDSFGCTPLHIACNSGNFNAAKLLCAHGADTFLVSEMRMLASDYAERNRGSEEYNQHKEFIDKLPCHKRRKEPKEIKQTSLHRAAWFGDTDIVFALVKAGANIEAVDDAGRKAEDLTHDDGIRFFLKHAQQRKILMSELKKTRGEAQLAESDQQSLTAFRMK